MELLLELLDDIRRLADVIAEMRYSQRRFAVTHSSTAGARSTRFPFEDFPTGWYAQCFSRELGAGGVLGRRFMGREVVLFRRASGQVGMLDAHCPHMGAHLAFGGRVEGEHLRCPMHGFRFDGDGRCVATGYGTKPPPKCQTQGHHVLERNGIVLAYYGAGTAPAWEPPVLDMAGFSPLRTHVFPGLQSHPQETTENSVDLGHLAVVHGYESVEVLLPLETHDQYLTTCYRVRRRPLLPGTPAIEATFTIHVHGLGYSFVDVAVPSHRLRTRYFVLSTPVDREHVDLRLAGCLRPEGLLGLLPVKTVDRLLGALVFRGFLSDVKQDVPIWANKICVQPPALGEGDGPIGKYRSWAKQFYVGDGGGELRRSEAGGGRLNKPS